jgi:hypothetical protein
MSSQELITGLSVIGSLVIIEGLLSVDNVLQAIAAPVTLMFCQSNCLSLH